MGDTSLRPAELAELLKGLAADVREYVAHELVPVMVRLDEITKRLDALEQQRSMTFEGAFDPGRQYAAGAVVQRQGSTWACLVTTAEPPGASPAWRRLSGEAR